MHCTNSGAFTSPLLRVLAAVFVFRFSLVISVVLPVTQSVISSNVLTGLDARVLTTPVRLVKFPLVLKLLLESSQWVARQKGVPYFLNDVSKV